MKYLIAIQLINPSSESGVEALSRPRIPPSAPHPPNRYTSLQAPAFLNPADNFQDIIPARFAAREEDRTFPPENATLAGEDDAGGAVILNKLENV
jgi:hypothetical protein